MRTRLSLALAALCLATAARGDILQASSTTVVAGGQLWRSGEARSALPVFELVSVSASQLQTGWGEFELTLSGWGSLDAGSARAWQGGAPPTTARQAGDLDVGYLRGELLDRRLSIRLGRQVVVEGNARMLHLDGAQAFLRLGGGFGLSAFGGAPVYPRFDARGTELAAGNARADKAYGGRLSWARAGLVDAGVSAIVAEAGSDPSRKDVGADLRLTPVHGLELLGSGFYSLYEGRLGQAELAATWQVSRAWAVLVDWQKVEPDLFLPRNSLLAAFVSGSRNDAGGGLRWTPGRGTAVEADYHLLQADDGDGSRVRVKGTLRPGAESSVGADLQLLKVPENGFLAARLFGSRAWGALTGTADLWYYRYDKAVNGEDRSVGATVTGGLQLAPAWRVLVAATAASDPWFSSRFDVMAKLAWTQTFVREVR